jgi:hypothetical protein
MDAILNQVHNTPDRASDCIGLTKSLLIFVLLFTPMTINSRSFPAGAVSS